MPTQIFNDSNVEKAADFVQNGHLLAYPTEAVWGLGCDPFNETAVQQILTIKNRPIEKGMIVVTGNVKLITPFLASLSYDTQNHILQTWQQTQNQATTFLFPIPSNISMPNWVTGGRDTLAIRVIHHPLIASLCQAIARQNAHNPYGFLISTSCNPTSEAPATTLQQAYDYFGDSIGYLSSNTLGFTQPSQIIDVLTNHIIRL